MLTKGAIISSLMIIIALAGCGGKGGSNVNGPTTTEGAEFQIDTGGILYGVAWNGQNLTAGSIKEYKKGGYYIIGSCLNSPLGGDDLNNVNSQSFRFGGSLKVGETRELSGTLRSPTTFCPGAEYTVIIKRVSDAAVESDISIRPLPKIYAALSLPIDLTRLLFDIYRWPGGSGQYDAIDGGLNISPQEWIEACSSAMKICIRRTVLYGDYALAQFYNNNGIHNLELFFGGHIPAGKTFHLRERIEITKF